MITYNTESELMSTNENSAVNLRYIDAVRYETDTVQFLGDGIDIRQDCDGSVGMLTACFEDTTYQQVMDLFVASENVVAYNVDSPESIEVTMKSGRCYTATQLADEDPVEVIIDILCRR